ncbi:hypothetical protein [Petrimonas sp.]|uniref:hypothetical protein n=1 Tax=Petrimonas sp. TaxID=2023866 RepID=UPI003F5166E4
MKNQQQNTSYHPFDIPNNRMKVVSFRRFSKTKRTKMIAAIAFCQLAAWLLYSGLNVSGYLQSNSSETSFLTKIGFAFAHVFSQPHFIWFTLTSVLGVVGLLKVKSWGWAVALITNSLYVFIITMAYSQNSLAGNQFERFSFIFLILLVAFSTIYLWIKRFVFWR